MADKNGGLPSSEEEGERVPTTSESEPPYSVWSRGEKYTIVTLASLAATTSAMSGQIYFPALQMLADAFDVSLEAINMTVTSYLILQGISPMILGPLADAKGRRLALLICLTILTASCIGMAVMPQDAYWLLVVLRGCQSAGSASTISISFGVVADVTTPHERGSFVGLAVLLPMLGPTAGPVLGGALADAFGWRAIFWFMAAFSASIGLAMLLIMPETVRTIVGNGSIAPPWHLRPVLPILTKYDRHPPTTRSLGDPISKPRTKLQRPTFLKEPDVLVALVSFAVIFALFQAMSASITPMLLGAYPFLTQTTIGLCFLPVGAGSILGAAAYGRVLDSEFRRMGGTKGAAVPPDFPIEKARLRLVPVSMLTCVGTAMIFGWTVGRTSIAVPLTFNLLYGGATIAYMNSYQTYMLDIVPGQGASVSAANNLFRCLLGAGIVAAVDALRGALGNGWLFVLLGGAVVVLSSALLIFSRLNGPRCREKRRKRNNE